MGSYAAKLTKQLNPVSARCQRQDRSRREARVAREHQFSVRSTTILSKVTQRFCEVQDLDESQMRFTFNGALVEGTAGDMELAGGKRHRSCEAQGFLGNEGCGGDAPGAGFGAGAGQEGVRALRGTRQQEEVIGVSRPLLIARVPGGGVEGRAQGCVRSELVEALPDNQRLLNTFLAPQFCLPSSLLPSFSTRFSRAPTTPF